MALDPVPFDSIEEANQNTLLNALIWSSISEDKEYERDEVGAMYLPTADIDAAAAELYGPDVHFTYQTFEDRGLTYQYVEEKQAYLLPITSVITDYYPQVEEIRREGDTVRVTVGYLSQFSSGTDFSPDMQYAPVKYQDYLFRRDGDNTGGLLVLYGQHAGRAGPAGGAGQHCQQPAHGALFLFGKRACGITARCAASKTKCAPPGSNAGAGRLFSARRPWAARLIPNSQRAQCLSLPQCRRASAARAMPAPGSRSRHLPSSARAGIWECRAGPACS